MTIHIFIDLFSGSITVRESFLETLGTAVLSQLSGESWPFHGLLLLPRALWDLVSMGKGTARSSIK